MNEFVSEEIIESRKLVNDVTEYVNHIIEERRKLERVNYIEQIEIMNRIYNYSKICSNKLYTNNKMHWTYKFLKEAIVDCEYELSNVYILDTLENFDYDDDTILTKKKESVEDILDYIVYKVREKIYMDYNKSKLNYHMIPLSKIDLSNKCKEITKYVNDLCGSLGIKSERIRIEPGFSRRAMLFEGNGFHYFNVIEIENKKYLVDISYKQFFLTRFNILQRIGTVGFAGCTPGIYMMLDDEKKKLASDLIKNGWVEWNDKNIKNYFDGFVLNVRNGLYYEELGKIDYSVSYTSNDYLNFIYNDDDNILKYEPMECIGRQKRPLKTLNMNFNVKGNIK